MATVLVSTQNLFIASLLSFRPWWQKISITYKAYYNLTRQSRSLTGNRITDIDISWKIKIQSIIVNKLVCKVVKLYIQFEPFNFGPHTLGHVPMTNKNVGAYKSHLPGAE